jgi:hypothetical protein
MGRPRPEDPALGIISVAVNQRDKARLKAAATAAGLPLSTFPRTAATVSSGRWREERADAGLLHGSARWRVEPVGRRKHALI